MARIPRYRPQVSPSVGASFNLPNFVERPTVPPVNAPFREVPNYKGAAFEALGGAIRTLGAGLIQLGEMRQATADTAWFSRARAQTGIDWLRKETELRAAADASGAIMVDGPKGAERVLSGSGAVGFTDMANAAFEEYVAGVVEQAPSETAKQTYLEWAEGFRGQVQAEAFGFEYNSLIAQRTADFNEAMDAHIHTVFADPDKYDVVLARSLDDLEGARAWMTPEAEIKTRETIETNLQLARAKKLANWDPLRFQEEVGLATGPLQTTAAKIIGIESGGQFTDSVWLETIRRHRPDLAGLSDNDLIALKANADLVRQMTLAHTKDNAAGLTLAGIQASETNLYLARFLHLDGAKAVLSEPDATKLANILPAEVFRDNPHLKGMTVGDIRRWASAKMAGATPADMGSFVDNPYYSRLTPDQIFALAKDADSAVLEQHKAALAERQAIYDARYNTLALAVLDGQAGLADIQEARKEGWLGGFEDIKRLTDMVTQRDKDAIKVAQAIGRLDDPNTRFNPYREADRDDVDIAYKAMGGDTGLTAGNDVSVGRLRRFIERTDIVPDTARDALKAGIRSADLGEMQKSLQVLDGLYRAYPAATVRTFSEDDIKRLMDYQQLAPVTQPEELQRRMDVNQDPVQRKLTEELRAEGRTLAAEIETSEILSAFDPSFWRSAPGVPLDAGESLALRHDFETYLAERYAVSGNLDAAKKQALELTALKWGPTETGSDFRIMRYPPEWYYDPIDGNHDWMAEQLAETVEAEVGTVNSPSHGSMVINAESWGIVMAPETEAAIAARQLPPYYVIIVTNDGAHRVLTNDDGTMALFRFDAEAVLAERREQARQQIQQRLAPPPVDRQRLRDLENERRRSMGLEALPQ